MEKIGIFYGSTTGNTAAVAAGIAAALNVADADVHDVAKTAPSAVAGYGLLILGCSTWGDGDMQDDMHDFLDGIASLDLRGKKIALFGCGDDTMSDTFCNAVGKMYDMLKDSGATFVGRFDVAGYDFEKSDAVTAGEAMGLLIDNVNHENLTDRRINEWCDLLKSQI